MEHQRFFADIRRSICVFGALALLTGITTAVAQTTAPATDKSGGKGAAAPAATQPAAADKQGSSKGGMQGMGASDGNMHESMMGMMKGMESMKMTGDTDRDFATMMKIHHQGAIDMAQMELKSGKDAKMRAMARQIIAAQQKEIKEFDQWLGKHK